jgi:hypothetical protein
MTTRTRLACCDSDALKKSKVHSSNFLLLQVKKVSHASDAICLIICKRGCFSPAKTHSKNSTHIPHVRTSSVSEKLLYIFSCMRSWHNGWVAYLICLFINFLVWRNKTLLVGNPHSRHSTQKYRRRRRWVSWLAIHLITRPRRRAAPRASSRSLNGMCVTRA